MEVDDASWEMPAAIVAELEVTQAVGAQVELVLPVSSSLCLAIGEALALSNEHVAGCDDGTLALDAPTLVTWTGGRSLLTGPVGAAASAVSILPLQDLADGGQVLRLDVTSPTTSPQFCFHAAPDVEMTLAAAGRRYEHTVEAEAVAVDCDTGLRLVIGGRREGGASPAVILRDIATFRFGADSSETRVDDLSAVVALDPSGTRDLDGDSLEVHDGAGQIETSIDITTDASRLEVTGAGITEAIAGDGDNLVPNWWERSRNALFPVTTGLLAAAITAFATFVNVLTEQRRRSTIGAARRKRVPRCPKGECVMLAPKLLSALTSIVVIASGCGEDESPLDGSGADVTGAATTRGPATAPPMTGPSTVPTTAAPVTSAPEPMTTSSGPCAQDTIEPQGSGVQLKVTGQVFEAVTAARGLPCPAEISINGGAAAQLVYVEIATCTIRQADDNQSATYLSKPDTGVFLKANHGRADCSLVGNEPATIEHCGVLLTTDGGSVTVQCEEDRATAVSTNASTVKDQAGNVVQLTPNQSFEFEPFSPFDQGELCRQDCPTTPLATRPNTTGPTTSSRVVGPTGPRIVDPNPPVIIGPDTPGATTSSVVVGPTQPQIVDPNPPVIIGPDEVRSLSRR